MLEVTLHNPRQHKQLRRSSGPLLLARTGREPALWATADRGTIGPEALVEIVPRPAGVSLEMVGCEAECHCGRSCGLTGSCQLPVPATFTIGDTRFEITNADRRAPHRPLQKLRNGGAGWRSHKSPDAGPSPATLSRWFAALSSLNHWATSLQELYIQAARCAVEAIGLDGGIVLRRRDGEWEIAASVLPFPELGIQYDVAALNELLVSPRTLFHGSSSGSPSNAPAILLSPLRNAAGEVTGAVYGFRSVRSGNGRRAIRYLEAHMFELLASAVSAGIARIEREAETDCRRVLLEHAVADSQNRSARQISAQQREVTLLFADLRNSTELSAMLGANEAYELMRHVMECLSAAVIDHDGLIIDYYGDGLAAMWNAPADQSDHAELACRAALRMLKALPDISSDWADMIQRELQLGIGIHTGEAHVGNTGSQRRAKYGPRGTNVNLTSRVEAATKQLALPLLATEATAKQLSNRFAAHRVCRARMPGFDRPIDLYSVCLAPESPQLLSAWKCYSDALECFEHGRLQETIDTLATIDAATSEIPASFLHEHAQRELAKTRRRRSTDMGGESIRGGVIKLGTK